MEVFFQIQYKKNDLFKKMIDFVEERDEHALKNSEIKQASSLTLCEGKDDLL